MRYQEILEASAFRDYRHEPRPHLYRKSWTARDISMHKPDRMIAPAEGFFFQYGSDGKFVLHSAESANHSRAITLGSWEAGDADDFRIPWNELDGWVEFSTKTVTIAKESVRDSYRQRVIANIKVFQKLLRELLRHGVTPDYKVKGIANMPKTVGEVLEMRDPTDAMFAKEQLGMFHGTSMARWREIEASGRGLMPGQTRDEYVDLIDGYSEHNVYLATNPKGAEFYGKRQAKKEGDDAYVVLRVSVPDAAKIVSDDQWARHETNRGLRLSGRELGEFGYKGRIPMTCLSVLKIGKA